MITKLANGTYKVDFVLNGQRYRQQGFRTKKEAESWAKSKQGDGLVAFIPRYLQFCAHNKTHTKQAKAGCINNYILPKLGSIPLAQIAENLPAFRQWLASTKKSTGTQNLVLEVLQHILSTAHSDGKLDVVPKIKLLPRTEKTILVLTPKQENMVIDILPDQWSGLAVVGLNTGLRIGELLALTVADVDFENCRLNVSKTKERNGSITTPKSGKSRVVPLNQKALSVLTAECKAKGLRDELWPFSHSGATYWATRLSALVGCNFHWHLLRHTFATRIANSGIPLHHLQRLLGHSSIRQTMRYSSVAEQNLRDAVAVLD